MSAGITSSPVVVTQSPVDGRAALSRGELPGSDETGRSFALLVRLAMRTLPKNARNWQSAEDIVQDALLQIWQEGVAERSQDPFAIRWGRVVIALCRSREERSRYVHCLSELKEVDTSASWAQIEQAVGQEEQSPRARIVAQLPAHHRNLLELHFLARMSIREMAALLGWSPRAVRRRVRSAVVCLKQRLGDAQFGGESLFPDAPLAAASAS